LPQLKHMYRDLAPVRPRLDDQGPTFERNLQPLGDDIGKQRPRSRVGSSCSSHGRSFPAKRGDVIGNNGLR
jgi:hypothetical protein